MLRIIPDQALRFVIGTPLRATTNIDLTIFEQSTDAGKQLIETTERVGEELSGVNSAEGVVGSDDKSFMPDTGVRIESHDVCSGDVAHFDAREEQTEFALERRIFGLDASGPETDGAQAVSFGRVLAHLFAELLCEAVNLEGLAGQILVDGQVRRRHRQVSRGPQG